MGGKPVFSGLGCKHVSFLEIRSNFLFRNDVSMKEVLVKKRIQTFGTLALPGHPLSCKGEL